MKTNELKKWLTKNNIPFKEYDKVIEVTGLARVLKTSVAAVKIYDVTLLYPDKIKCLEKILEYAKTPLEEREEEKKYLLRTPFNDCIYLNFYKDSYMFAGKIQEAGYQTKFTQKEIDAMPFDTNFFIKEQV